MIEPLSFIRSLNRVGVGFFSGVPDSLLASLIKTVASIAAADRHIVAANEGSAVALACGYHLATGRIGAVYMQNSGLGNAINPLMSIADSDVYGIPLLLIIGWRGEPGVKDEPQHVKQGAISEELLNTLRIPYCVLDGHSTDADVDAFLVQVKQHEGPSAFLVRKDCFSEFITVNGAKNTSSQLSSGSGNACRQSASSGNADVPPTAEIEEAWVAVVPAQGGAGKQTNPSTGAVNPVPSDPGSSGSDSSFSCGTATVPMASGAPAIAPVSSGPLMSREDAIRFIQTIAPADAILVATTGKIGRELYEIRQGSAAADRDFYCVGGMGHASQIALGIALNQPGLVICLDGDGAALMHLGHLSSIAALAPDNFMHIILNNQMHESVGGQPTANPQTNFAELAKVLGYPATCRCSSLAELISFFASMRIESTPIMIEMLVAGGSREDLVRPKESPRERKIRFMKALGVGDASGVSQRSAQS